MSYVLATAVAAKEKMALAQKPVMASIITETITACISYALQPGANVIKHFTATIILVPGSKDEA